MKFRNEEKRTLVEGFVTLDSVHDLIAKEDKYANLICNIADAAFRRDSLLHRYKLVAVDELLDGREIIGIHDNSTPDTVTIVTVDEDGILRQRDVHPRMSVFAVNGRVFSMTGAFPAIEDPIPTLYRITFGTVERDVAFKEQPIASLKLMNPAMNPQESVVMEMGDLEDGLISTVTAASRAIMKITSAWKEGRR